MQTDTILHGDIRQIARTLPDGSVHEIVTSPPYYGLRDYGTAEWEGGREDCDHMAPPTGGKNKGPALGGASNRDGHSADGQYRNTCPKCGAIRKDAQIGLEASPQEYVDTLVGIFRELRRVLRDDGTVWLNLGDSYCSSPPGNKTVGVSASSGLHGVNGVSGKYRATLEAGHATKKDTSKIDGLKPKDLIGIPWRVALALQADGWYLRADIIWSKPNPMPESVTDRPTKAHEYMFLLSKSPRYYYDQEAVREKTGEPVRITSGMRSPGYLNNKSFNNSGNKDGWGGEYSEDLSFNGRNRRTVWTVATQPYKPAHFATFPPDLISPAILAGCPERVCLECGAPWVRVVERESSGSSEGMPKDNGRAMRNDSKKWAGRIGEVTSKTTGFRPTCNHYDHLYLQDFPKSRKPRKRYQRDTSGDWWRRVRQRPGLDSWPSEPGVILDPFMGSGTVGQVAIELDPSRRWLGCELSQYYIDQAWDRINAAKLAKVAGRDYAKQMTQEIDGYQQLGLIGA